MNMCFLASFSMEKASHSPSNAWLPKPLSIFVAFYRGYDVPLPGPILEVGPHSLSVFWAIQFLCFCYALAPLRSFCFCALAKDSFAYSL
jgi:hypothetical protein